MKIQPVKWAKIFLNPISDKGLISMYTKNLQNPTTKNWANYLKRYFFNGQQVHEKECDITNNQESANGTHS